MGQMLSLEFSSKGLVRSGLFYKSVFQYFVGKGLRAWKVMEAEKRRPLWLFREGLQSSLTWKLMTKTLRRTQILRTVWKWNHQNFPMGRKFKVREDKEKRVALTIDWNSYIDGSGIKKKGKSKQSSTLQSLPTP